MAVTVTALATAANSVDNFTGDVQAPSAWSLAVPLSTQNSSGNWMVALVAWRQQPQLTPVTMAVGDDVHNYWEPLGAPTGTSSASGITRCSIWYAPAAKRARAVCVAPSAAYLTVGVILLEIDGMTPYLSLSALTTRFANASTTLGAMTLAAPASQMIAFSVCGTDLQSSPPTLSGSGWTRTASTSANDGVDTNGDLYVSGAYQVTSGSVSATWNGASQDFSGVTAGLLVAGSAAPSPAQSFWPATITEVALGAGANTPADQLAWTPITARTMNMEVTQGRQYQLAALQTGSGSVTFDNPDGELIPPGSSTYAGIDSGTPLRTRMIWAGPSWPLQFHGNGSTAEPAVESGKIFPVTVGVTYTAACWMSMLLPDSGGLVFTLEFYNSGGTSLSFIEKTTLDSGTFLAVVSATAPATAATAQILWFFGGTPVVGNIASAAPCPPGPPAAGYLNIPAAVSWLTIDAATIITSNPWKYDVRGAPQTSPHSVVFSGFVQKWPQQWDVETQRGIVTASLVDAWNYCNGNLQPIIFQEILEDAPYAYWPMTDAAGSIQASNQAPGNNLPLVVQSTKYGNGGATEAFGANSSALLGAQGTLLLTSSVRQQAQSGMWEQTLPSHVTATPIYAQGYTASCTDGGYPPIEGANGITVECWFQITPPFQTPSYESVLVVRQTNQVIFSVTVNNTSGNLVLTQGTLPAIVGSGGISIGQSGIDYRNMGSIEHLAITANISSWTAYINGQFTADGNWTGAGIPGTFSVLSFNSDTIQPQSGLVPGALSGVYNAYNGYLAHAALFGYQLPQGRIYSHYIAGQFASIVDGATFRLERLLEAGGYLGRRVMLPDTAGSNTVLASCQDIAGQPASTSISNIVADTTPATLTVSPAGELFYLSRGYAYNQSIKWIIGDDPANGEYVYAGNGFLIDYDPTRTINDIQLTQLDNQDIVIPDIDETSSVLQYGDNTYWQTGYLYYDLTQPIYSGPGLVDLANWIASTNIQPFLRPATVTVDAASNPGNWPFVMGAAAGDMVTVIRRPPTSGQVFSFIGRISQHQRTIHAGTDGSTASITCTIDPAPEASVLTLNDSVYGLLNGTNRLMW